MASATSFAQVQTDRFSASTLRSMPSRSISRQSSGRGSVTPTSSLDGEVLLLESRGSRPSSRENSSAASSGVGTLGGGPSLSFRKLARGTRGGDSGGVSCSIEDVVLAKRTVRGRFSSAVSQSSVEGTVVK